MSTNAAVTKTTTSTVEVTLDDFDTEEILEYLGSTHLTRSEVEKLKEILFENYGVDAFGAHVYSLDNLGDQLKFEACKEAMEKYSLAELEKRLA